MSTKTLDWLTSMLIFYFILVQNGNSVPLRKLTDSIFYTIVSSESFITNHNTKWHCLWSRDSLNNFFNKLLILTFCPQTNLAVISNLMYKKWEKSHLIGIKNSEKLFKIFFFLHITKINFLSLHSVLLVIWAINKKIYLV